MNCRRLVKCAFISVTIGLFVGFALCKYISSIRLQKNISDFDSHSPLHGCISNDFTPNHSISVWTFLTLSDTNYIKGAIKLGLSVLRHSTFNVDLIVMEISEKPIALSDWTKLKQVGWSSCVVKRLAPRDEKHTFPRFRDQFTKLHLWAMTSYRTVVYFDADTLVVGNIDALLKTQLMSKSIGVTRDIRGGVWMKTFNMGVFLIHPNKFEYYKLLRLKNDPSLNFETSMSEQGFLNVVYRNLWQEIGFIYNANLAVLSQRKKEWNTLQSDMRVIHYTMQKPWECSGVYSQVCYLWKNASTIR